MKTIITYYGQPILDIVKGISKGKEVDFGVFRDRYPDTGWSEVQQVNMEIEDIKEEDLTDELKLILLSDLAYVFGNNTIKFTEKILEFKLL